MTIYVHRQGERFDIVRTFTAVDGAGLLSTVTATCVQLDPNGAIHTVTLSAATLDNVADPPTATFTGSYLVPRDPDSAGMWVERWDTDDDLQDVADQPWWCTASPVVAIDGLEDASV